jgi:hypothetical protein
MHEIDFSEHMTLEINALQIKNLSGNTVPEYKMQQVKRSRLILLHYGIYKIGWDWLILLCTFYVAIVVPYNAAFVNGDFGTDGSGQNTTANVTAVTELRASIVSDVIVEVLFIIGESLTISVTCLNTCKGDLVPIRKKGQTAILHKSDIHQPTLTGLGIVNCVRRAPARSELLKTGVHALGFAVCTVFG